MYCITRLSRPPRIAKRYVDKFRIWQLLDGVSHVGAQRHCSDSRTSGPHARCEGNADPKPKPLSSAILGPKFVPVDGTSTSTSTSTSFLLYSSQVSPEVGLPAHAKGGHLGYHSSVSVFFFFYSCALYGLLITNERLTFLLRSRSPGGSSILCVRRFIFSVSVALLSTVRAKRRTTLEHHTSCCAGN